MATFPSDTYVFGTAHYRPVIDSLQLRTPIPVAPIFGDWVHISYSSVNVFETDGGRLNSSWSVRVVLPTVADYTAMQGLYGTWQTLTTDFGTFTALLRQMDGFQLNGLGFYVGTCVWEWSA